jgi:hypothetical protein
MFIRAHIHILYIYISIIVYVYVYISHTSHTSHILYMHAYGQLRTRTQIYVDRILIDIHDIQWILVLQALLPAMALYV